MQPVCLHQREAIEAVLRRDVPLHLYELGDLDDFFWPYTTWYGWRGERGVEQLALLYSGGRQATLIALCREDDATLRALLRATARLLPSQLYAHLAPGLADELAQAYRVGPRGQHRKMSLVDPSRLGSVDVGEVEALAPRHGDEIQQLLASAYPHHWFEPRMLETGQYVGLRRAGQLVCVAGVHVYSARYRVAALGNVATHPDARGEGLATRACAKLCRQLLESVDHVGLNVAADNHGAVRCYERLGFETIARYEECELEARRG